MIDAIRNQAERDDFWKGQYDKYLRDQLAQVARLAEQARADGHWQFLEDLNFRREALLRQLTENEKDRRLKRRGEANRHQEQSAGLTGWWIGQPGTGVVENGA